MKAIYLNTKKDQVDLIIKNIQDAFGRIYRFEETTILNSFRGNLGLDEILLIHLRMIDDGIKIINPETKHVFNSPSKTGNREENILFYIDEKLKNKEKVNITSYIENLVKKFEESVKIIVEELPKLDLKNPIIGDTLILEKNYSLSFFIIIKHLESLNKLDDKLDDKLLTTWEKLLFTRDLHDKYKGLWYTDDFELLFFEITKGMNNVQDLIEKFVITGFRSNKFSLKSVVEEYLKQNESMIMNSAYNWHKEKMIYLLYKYEISLQNDCRKNLRELLKNGVSVEHILPQEWDLEWTIFKDNTSNDARLFLDKIYKVINGIGNLLLLSTSENSSQSNSHPMNKNYNIHGESYEIHNKNKHIWKDHTKWEEIITSRGKAIYKYLIEFIENK